MAKPMTTVLDSLPEKFRSLYMREIGERDPELLTRLLNSSEPSRADRVAVEDILSSSFMKQLNADYSPTPTGAEIDNALGAFLLRWPIERD